MTMSNEQPIFIGSAQGNFFFRQNAFSVLAYTKKNRQKLALRSIAVKFGVISSVI